MNGDMDNVAVGMNHEGHKNLVRWCIIGKYVG
jgi:hypothetical protein